MKSRAAVYGGLCRVCNARYNQGDDITFVGSWMHVNCTEDDENGVRVRKTPLVPNAGAANADV